MRKAALISLCIVLLLAGYASGSELGFADPNLTAVVEAELRALGREVSVESLKTIVELKADNHGISNLAGIEQLINLRSLDISFNPVRDLTPLQALTQLTSLNLRETLVTDLSPVVDLGNLEYLNIHSIPAVSIEPISALTKLETLIMRNVYIGEDTSFLKNLTNLKRLNLRSTGLTDTLVLADLMRQGALQNQHHLGIRAELDIRDNPLQSTVLRDDYEPIRPYWVNIFAREPVVLPDVGEQNVLINEFMAANSSTLKSRSQEYYDWIELYNPQPDDVDLTGYYLSDSLSNPLKWRFPANAVIPAGGYILVYASGLDQTSFGEIHTNFKLGSEGEPLLLSDPEGRLQDYIPPKPHMQDISYGRSPDGSDSLVFFQAATPGKPNSTDKAFAEKLQPPKFSHVRGFYPESFYLELSSADPDVIIYYTLDGSVPTPDSSVYQEPILIGPGNTTTELLSLIKTFGPFNLNRIEQDYTGQKQTKAFLPWTPQDVYQGIVVRAAAYKDGVLASDVETHTYFVDEDIYNRYSLPIISIATDPGNFFDHNYGIYVAGAFYFNFRPGRPWHNPGNYTQRGIMWERPVHVEFFEPGGMVGFTMNMGARTHGGITRAWPQKSLKLYARSSYQPPGIVEYPIFPGLTTTGTGEPLTEFKRILLRNAGNHWSIDLFADALMHELIAHTKVDVMAYRPAVVFINGEYWGIHNIRERLDQHYLAAHYNLDPENVVITTHYDELDYGNPGDERDLHEITAYVQRNNMASAQNYQYITTKIDIDQFIDYQVAQIFYSNTDWPGKNTAAWRYKTDQYDPDAPYGQDGRWRWMMFDTDFGFGYVHGTGGDFNSMEHATGSRGPLLRGLLENPNFRIQFINTFADHLNSSFTLDRIITMIDQFEAVLEPEIAEHIARWGNPGRSVEEWKQNVNKMRIWAQNRHKYIWTMLTDFFKLPGTATVTLNSDLDAGYIQINTLDLVPETPGITNPESWQGTYLRSVPIKVTAHPKPGYEFVGWEGSRTSTETQLEIMLTSDLELTAVFRKL
ncbi:MAG: CotH kinase family protein [Candidatus Wallacebacter cryptica]|nr:dockerin [Bacillota bacterium]